MTLLALTLVKARLIDEVPSLRDVGFAADFAAVTNPGGVIASPSAYIVQTGATAREIREGSGPLRQVMDVTIAVLVAVRLAGQRGAAGLTALEAPVDAVRTALFGWFHPEADKKFELVDEALEDFDGKTGVAVYRLDFRAPRRIQEP